MGTPEKSNQELVVSIQQMKDELQKVSLQLEHEIKTRKLTEFLLAERQKELNCQNQITSILSSKKIDVAAALNKILDTIPPAMRFPDIAEALISFNGISHKTKHYTDSEYCIEQLIFIDEKQVGEVKVCYPHEKYNGGKEAFLKEEYELIFNIAARISGFLSQKEEERMAADSFQKYQSFMHASPDSLTITDLNGSIEFASPSTYTVFGYKISDNLIGKNIFEFIDPSEKVRAKKRIENMFAGIFAGVEEYKGIKADGSHVWIDVSGEFIRNNDSEPVKMIFIVRDTSQKKETAKKLRKSEERFEQIAEQSNTVIWEVDNTGLFTYVNNISEKVLGYKPEEIIGKMYYYDLHPVANRTDFINITRKVMSEQQHFVGLTNQIVKKDGDIIIVSTNGIPVLDINGNLIGYRGADNDITDKVKAEEELRLYQKATDAATYGIAISNLDGELIYLNKALAQMHGWQPEELVGKNLSVLHNSDQLPQVQRLQERLFSEGKFISEELWHTRKDGSVFPTLMNGTLIIDDQNNPTYFSASAIEITHIKQAEQKIRESEFKYRSIFENIQDTYYESAIDGTLLEISPSVQQLSKGLFTREELVGKSVFQLYNNIEERDKLIEQVYKFGKISDFEVTLRNKDLSFTPVSISATLIFDENNQPIKISGSIRDITKRKIAEENLKQSEERYRSMFKNNKSVILIIDPLSKKIVDANNAAAEFYGWSIEEICGREITDINSSPMHEINEKLKLAYSEANKQFFFKHILANGEIRDVEVFSGPIQDGNKTYLYSIIHDITDRKRAEEALTESEKNLNNAQQIAKMGSWEYNVVTGKVKWSENYYALLGMDTSSPPLALAEFEKIIHPEDRNLFEQKIEEINITGKIATLYFRFFKSDGDLKWIQANMAPVYDAGGQLIEVKGISIDITDKKIAEKELNGQKEKLQAIVKAIPDMMFIIDKDGMYLEYYAHAKHQLLVPRNQIIGRNIKDAFPTADGEIHLGNLKKCLQTHEIVEYEYSLNFSSQIQYFEARIVPMSNQTVLCFIREITERKQSELAIRKLSQAVEHSPVITFITDRGGKIEYVNQAFEDITGYSFDEVKGKNPRILKSGKTDKNVYQKLWETLHAGKIWRGEWLNRKKDGSLYWEDVTISPITNEKDDIVNFIAIKLDITQRKETEQKLKNFYLDLEQKVEERTSELAIKTHELENFFNVSLDLLCIADANGNFIKVNKAWSDILGYSVEELENHKILDFVHPDDLQATYEALILLQNDETVLKFINRYYTKTGKYRYIEWHSVPIGETIYAAARDITESKITADFQHELLQISSKLTGIPFAEIKPSIGMALEKIGKFLLADRAYIFEFSSDLMTMNNTYEWCNNGINPELENLQDLPVSIFPEWMKKLKKNEEISIPSVKDLPDDWAEEKAILEPQGIQSLLVIPLYSEKVLIGFAGLDFVINPREFNSFEVDKVKLWGTMLTGLINNYRIENLLEQSRQNMITFFNTVDDFLFVIDENGSIIYVNETVKKRLGYSVNELIGESVITVHPENRRKEALQIIGEMLEEKADYCPVPLITKQGHEIQVETRVRKGKWNGKPAIFGVTKDISQIKLSEEKFSTAFQTNVSLMAISNIDDSKYIEVNKSFLEVYGYTRDEVIGKTSADLGIFVDAPDDTEFKKHLMNNEPVRDVELRVRTKSGDIRTGLFSIDMISIGNERKYLATMVDITERKKIEKELIDARNEAEKANNAKSEFLSRMSHELRTPMNSILGFAQLLEMGDLNDRQKSGVNHILRSGKYLLNMINEVLELSRIEAGRLSLSIEPVGVNAVVKEILDLIRPQSEQKNISILTSAMSNELFVYADKQKLKQILLNIINNAIKYNNDAGQIEISVDVVKTEGKTGEYVRIAVVDNGTGISEENIGKIFSPFERIGVEKTGIEGTGLGLAVSKKLAEAMNGAISVESTVGSGSRFWIDFPFIQKGKSRREYVEAEKEINCVNAEITGTVLYFEDNESNIELIDQIIFENRPLVKFFAQKDGMNAVEFITKISPDLIFLDLNLPGKQGDEILEEILDAPQLKLIPVVMISADAMPQQIRNLLKIGARSYMTKPINVSQLLKTIDQYLIKSNI